MAGFGKGGVVVVTGGVGEKLRPRLEHAGFRVVGCARSGADVTMDLGDDASIQAGVEAILRLRGEDRLAGLVNLAGIIVEGPLELIPPEELRRQFEINVGAVTARTTLPFFGAVAASKAALASLTETLRMECAPLGIAVTLIEPGALKTDIFRKASDAQAQSLARQPREIVALYEPAMAAARTAMAGSPVDDPDVVARAIEAALVDARPKLRVLAGKGTATLALLGRLPARLRDHLLLSQLGITKALRTAY
ncbi:hypothetical protein CLG96_03990 [Sphingomonas oleivorans]|uniref:Short-chain dehydrogenase n=1 Tax=Sphingomonas oleivorans TaxID=1735121 RepID=A0A2T5G2F4_9SPHN|nr:SDR family NAD(P)-dependent oxidoreductase [Sphingomonas oleivorans]PTQ13281.1 hypothetical protein CLG96_03990 [Sphingomonas oleivorans]